VIYVGGGNTASLLAVWRAHGLDTILQDALAGGAVLCGVSAGMNCWFEASVTDSFGPALAPLDDGLGFIVGSACPHYDADEHRRPIYHRLVAAGFPAGFAADDGVALHFRRRGGARRGGGVARGRTRLPRRAAPDGAAVEIPLPTRYSGEPRLTDLLGSFDPRWPGGSAEVTGGRRETRDGEGLSVSTSADPDWAALARSPRFS
jgi:hypothetical protein